jgi:DMSO/TMAO reductase YedYZ molybdopterin-dependent catalytic subunit
MSGRREFLQTGGFALLGLLSGAGRKTFASEPPHGLEVFTQRPENLATPLGWFDRPITPTDVFFVRSHFGAPAQVHDGRLRVEGMVRTPLNLSLAELEAMPQTEITAVAQCAGNGRSLMEPRVPGVQWVHGAMGQAAWRGVRLRDVLERAGVANGALHIALHGADRPPKPAVPAFVRSIPLARASDPSTLIALRMNGEPLTHAHGAPMRLVVPGWTANHWVKWLGTITLQAAEAEGFYMQTAYRFPRTPGAPGAPIDPKDTQPLTTLPVKSVIARPQAGDRMPRGTQEVAGVAFSGDAAIARVEVSVDGGATWRKAALEGEGGAGRWQVFRLRFDAPPGRARAVARAIDAQGAVQPERAVWNPGGYLWNAWQAVEWEVV